MATGTDLLTWARAQVGKPYDASSDAVRFGPNAFDCSGLVVASCRAAGTPLPPEAGTNSASIIRYCSAHGLTRPVSEALTLPGAILVMGPRNGFDGYGPLGHIAFTVGNQRDVVEARGHAFGVVEGIALGRSWTNAAILPGVQYAPPMSQPPHRDPDGLGDLYHALHDLGSAYNGRRDPILRVGSAGASTKQLQVALAGLGFRLTIDGKFGPQTAGAIQLVQRQGNIAADGIVGLQTYRVLSRLLLARFP